MAAITEHDVPYASGGKTIHYLAAGPSEGPLIIFLHGWPAIALTWKAQLQAFAALGFRVVAPDMPGWGKSSHRRIADDYTLEAINEGMLALLEATGRSSAVWVAHDWGAGVASSLAAQHPDVIRALVLLCIPYKSAELGLDHLVSLVDRAIYPEDEHPYGQWDYMKYYEESFDKCIADLEANIPGLLRLLYAPQPPGGHDIAIMSQPAFTAGVRKRGGLFGGNPAPPVEVLPAPLLEGEVFDTFLQATEKTGIWAGSAYYLHHKANAEYSSKAPNGGRLGKDKPVLFMHAKFDSACSTLTSRLADPMREACENLTEVTIHAGHAIYHQKPDEVNAAIARFLVEEVKESWPGYADAAYHKA
ncbi:putative epoxide hydrolase [Stachybotrys elegans]|uniref:Epoxide hydrolase n=1 Tax=Stachybotrys elegans TaxID=80388 RepID=A0A8K0SJ14_9HYPO|nr:putative epoxide hydrolase [Stachybotrys elegans]